MGLTQFDISKLADKVFNIKLPEYSLNKELALRSEPISGRYGSSPYRKADVNGRYYFLPVELGGVELQYPIVRMNRRKVIVETPVTERGGSVIEQVSKDVWKMTIRGFMVNHQGLFPEDMMYELLQLEDRDEALVIRSVITDLVLTSDDRVVLTGIEFPEVQGVENVKPYIIELVSDSVFTLEIE